MFDRMPRRAVLVGALACVLLGLAAAAPDARAEQGWVRDEIRINVRTGPSTKNRIVGVIKTGDAVRVLKRGEGWTQVRVVETGAEGWIPEGYLLAKPPPGIRLAELEVHAAELEEQLARVTKEAEELGSTNEVLATQDGEQEARIKALTLENMELKAGARYPEWITGALIFASGMLLGAILRSSFAKRSPQRVRL
jgi:uncharacterized protein YgiM (DUF1202 family)